MTNTRILIVDDEPAIVKLCQRILEHASYQVVPVSDAGAALETIKNQEIDLLITDLMMPKMDGFELITQSRKIQPEMAILVMTAYGSIDMAVRSLHLGVNGLLLKPFREKSELLGAVEEAITSNQNKRAAVYFSALQPLFDISEGLISETNPDALEKLILNACHQFLNADYVEIYRKKPADDLLELVARLGDSFPEVKDWVEKHYSHPDQENQAPRVIRLDDPNSVKYEAFLKKAHLSGALIVPVKNKEVWSCFLAARGIDQQPFTTLDLEMFSILARQSAVALENARLYKAQRDYIDRVEESQKAVLQAERLAVMGRLVASVAHEVNNPLQSINNCLHLAIRKEVLPEQREQYLGMAQKELDHLITTVQRMINLYRPGDLEKEYIQVDELLGHVLELLRSQLNDNGIKVVYRVPKDLPPVWVVQHQIHQVLFNLIINAMDAMNSNSGDKYLWIEAQVIENTLKLFIEDSGPGVPAELQKRIFEPFISTKPSGTGLGLAISYDIMRAHAGDLQVVSSRKGRGACFEVSIPYIGEKIRYGTDINSR
ncbi:MAG: response regulator [Anaerolineaceae bacterium]|nr:response regulator [Anaerolineaceae bacterium]